MNANQTPPTQFIYGKLPQNWTLTTIGNLIEENHANLQTGPFGTMLHASAYVPIGTPVIAVKHIGANRLTHDDLPRVDADTYKRLIKYKISTDDIIFGRKGAVERRAIVTTNEAGWLQGSDCIRLRFSDGSIIPQFISYVLGSPHYQQWIAHNAQGATMPSLNQEIIKRIPLPLPPLPEQRAIAHILGTIDDKIELNRELNATLEATARAIFKSWFVDFDPVWAKHKGEQPVGMNAATAALFPDDFEESELGLIPRGWEIASLDKIAYYQNGIAWKRYKAEERETYLSVIKIREMRQGYVDESSDRSKTDIKPSCRVYNGDILFSWSGSLLVDIWTGGDGALNQHLFKVTSKKYPKWFYYHWTKYHLEQFQHIAAAKATTMGHIRRKDLKAAKTLIPPKRLMKHMSDIMTPFLEKIIINRLESRTLTELRDTLLPKLISGDLRVPEEFLQNLQD